MFSNFSNDIGLDIAMVLDEFDTLTAIQGYSEIISMQENLSSTATDFTIRKPY